MSIGRGATAIACLLLVGCQVPIAHLAAVGVDPAAVAASDRLEPRGEVMGLACRWWVLGVTLGLPTMDEAVAAALRPSGSVLLRDVLLRSDHAFYGPAGRHCYRVTGTAWGVRPSP